MGFTTKATLVIGLGLIVGGGALYLREAADATPPDTATEQEAATATAPVPVTQAALPTPDPDLPVVRVWKSPTCGCCGGWVDHLREAGFAVEVEDVQDLASVKAEHGVAPHLQSCHTALVDGFVVEGHVPADDIRKLLEERPEVAGLAVPGMPVGSPGMEYGDQVDPYDVLTFDAEGATTVWASHGQR